MNEALVELMIDIRTDCSARKGTHKSDGPVYLSLPSQLARHEARRDG